MTVLAVSEPMARKAVARKNPVVRVDQDAIDLANIVAAYRKITLTAYVSEVLRNQARKDHEEELAKLKRK